MNTQQPPPMPVLQANLQDKSHLNLLAIFHYILGGLCVLGLGFIILHYVMMTFAFGMASKMPPATAINSTPPTALVETTVEAQTESQVIETVIVPTSATTSAPASSPTPFPGFPKEVMTMMIGFYVVFGLIVSAMAAANFMSGRFIQMPFGTVLGVFTIIVLMRPSVQSGYEIKEMV